MSGAWMVPGVLLGDVALVVIAVSALVACPRRQRTPAVLVAVALGTATSLALAHSGSAAWLWALVPAALLPLRAVQSAVVGAGSDAGERAGAALTAMLGASATLLGAAALCAAIGDPLQGLAAPLLLVGLMWRMGVFPLHGWLPELAEAGTLPAILLAGSAPLAPLLLLAGLRAAPDDLTEALRLPLIGLGTVGALYGAVLALAQVHLRRMLAFLAVGQSGAMLAAAATGSHESAAGVVLAAVGYAIPWCGAMLLTGAVEARTGSARIDRLHGLGTPMPHLAAGFLVLGFALVGFPGSLGFVAEDVMLHGVLLEAPVVGALLLTATAVNAITVFRAFQRVFLGPLPVGEGLADVPDLLPRERAVVLVLVLFVGLSGVFPARLVDYVHAAVAFEPGVARTSHRGEAERRRRLDAMGRPVSQRESMVASMPMATSRVLDSGGVKYPRWRVGAEE